MTRQGHALRRARSLGRDERLIAALADTDPVNTRIESPTKNGPKLTVASCRFCTSRYDHDRFTHRPGCAWVGAHQRLGRPLPEGHTTQEDQP